MKIKPIKLAIVSAGMIAVGFGLCIASYFGGASTSVNWSNGHVDLVGAWRDANVEVINGIVSDNKVRIQEDISKVKEIRIEVDTMDVNILSGSQYGIDIIYNENTDFEYELSGKTLVITQEDFSNWKNHNNYSNKGVVNIYVPKGEKVDYTEISVGMGQTQISDVQIGELNLDCGMGEVKLSDIIADYAYVEGGMGSINGKGVSIDELQIGMGMGSVDIEGDLRGLVEISGGMGELKLTTVGLESEYNYNISKGMGSISLNGRTYNGLEDVEINNNASNNIIIEGGMGSIRVKTQ